MKEIRYHQRIYPKKKTKMKEIRYCQRIYIYKKKSIA